MLFLIMLVKSLPNCTPKSLNCVPYKPNLMPVNNSLRYNESTTIDLICLCFCRGMMDENNEQFVAYFLPTTETIGKRKEDDKAAVNYRDDEE